MYENKTFSYELLTKYRTHLMGIAMLWTILYHVELPKLPIIVDEIKSIGYGGVDIFIFLSGIGVYKSLTKDNCFKDFYKKRIVRIIPKYLLVVLIFDLIMLYSRKIEIEVALLNFTSFNFWLNTPSNKGSFNWYIPALLFLYLIAPLYIKLFNMCKNKEKFTFLSVILSLLCCVIVKTYLLILASRIAIFFIGILFGYYIKNKKNINNLSIILFFLIMIFGFIILFVFINYLNKYLWVWGLWWYPFTIITPFLCLFLAYMLQLIKNKAYPILRFLSFWGTNSLEIYLFHVSFILLFYHTWIKLYSNHLIIYNIICLIITVLCAIIFRMIVDNIIKKLNIN